jgi:hypothetical protein
LHTAASRVKCFGQLVLMLMVMVFATIIWRISLERDSGVRFYSFRVSDLQKDGACGGCGGA